MTKIDLLNYQRDELANELHSALGLEAFRAKQLFSWIYRRGVVDFSVMSDIATKVRFELMERYLISALKTKFCNQSIDGSKKYLFELADQQLIESVLVKQPTRNTLCISSQVGCAVNCAFCRTGTLGLQRNLTTAEIIGQVLTVRDDQHSITRDAENGSKFCPFDNIVLMGMGEPLHNFDNVVRAIRVLNDDLGLNFSSRKITVSTSGVVPAIVKLGLCKVPANLAVSLNATDDQTRSKLMPINQKWPLSVLLDTLRNYPLKRGRRITIEYVLIKGINDSLDDLARLPKLLRGIPAKVNLIPCNTVATRSYLPPTKDWVLHWQETLLKNRISSSIRWSKGEDIQAACGQLAAISHGESQG